ncbi:hypothetical protein [Actinoplanes xinjiangensis]|uniref:hypothetical protein n=1 Tax=Actinoplanes xinjiangensis TaxID=512350 RepID=UPI0034370A7A
MATRYDELKDRYLAMVTIASIMVWFGVQRDKVRPRSVQRDPERHGDGVGVAVATRG